MGSVHVSEIHIIIHHDMYTLPEKKRNFPAVAFLGGGVQVSELYTGFNTAKKGVHQFFLLGRHDPGSLSPVQGHEKKSGNQNCISLGKSISYEPPFCLLLLQPMSIIY